MANIAGKSCLEAVVFHQGLSKTSMLPFLLFSLKHEPILTVRNIQDKARIYIIRWNGMVFTDNSVAAEFRFVVEGETMRQVQL